MIWLAFSKPGKSTQAGRVQTMTTGKTRMQANSQADKNDHLVTIIRTVLCGPDEGITCNDCFDAVDQYVDMLRAGSEPSEVLPHVKAHLDECQDCESEFEAMITILEAASAPPESEQPT